MEDDKYFLNEAIKTGKLGKQKGQPPHDFGAVVVKGGKIIAKDYSHVHKKFDPTLHAESSAIKKAAKKLKTHHLFGCTLYASHEPCLMCFSCAVWSRMDRIVFAVLASELKDFKYDFKDVSIFDLAKKAQKRSIEVELVRVS